MLIFLDQCSKKISMIPQRQQHQQLHFLQLVIFSQISETFVASWSWKEAIICYYTPLTLTIESNTWKLPSLLPQLIKDRKLWRGVTKGEEEEEGKDKLTCEIWLLETVTSLRKFRRKKTKPRHRRSFHCSPSLGRCLWVRLGSKSLCP